MKKLLLILSLLAFSAPCFPAVTLVQSKGGTTSTRCDTNGATAASTSCTFGSTPTAGNLISAVIYYDDFNSTVTITCSDNKSNSYTRRLTSGGDASKNKVVICDGYATTSTATFTVTATASASTYIVIHIYEWNGLNTASAFDQSGTSNVITSSTSSTVTSGVTTAANELCLVGVSFSSNGAVPVAGTGFTLGEGSLTPASVTVVGGQDEYSTLPPSNSTGAQTATLTIGNTQSNGYGSGISTYNQVPAALPRGSVVF